MANILILHGPNLNLLGKREPHHYGGQTLAKINQQLAERAKQLGHKLTIFQSNGEHLLIEQLQQAPTSGIDFILFNPAAFTHTSIALRDSILAINIPFIEIHLSNIYQREQFRHHSYFSDIAIGVISGFGIFSYLFALEAADRFLKHEQRSQT